jgi:hypothetical protein
LLKPGYQCYRYEQRSRISKINFGVTFDTLRFVYVSGRRRADEQLTTTKIEGTCDDIVEVELYLTKYLHEMGNCCTGGAQEDRQGLLSSEDSAFQGEVRATIILW